jgi:hypothetical protein
VQYLSICYTGRLAAAGIEASVGSVGDSSDNALAETVNGLSKTEVIRQRGPWRNLEDVEFATSGMGGLVQQPPAVRVYWKHSTHGVRTAVLSLAGGFSHGGWSHLKRSPGNPGRFSNVTPKQGLAFVNGHGVVLQAARGSVPSLAEAIAGGPIQGSWWSHPKSHEIFSVTEAVSGSPEILVCKLVGGKVTYIHRRLWPALVKLASRFHKDQLDRVWNEHTSTGAHRSRRIRYPEWVPSEVLQQAEWLSIAEAEELLSPWPVLGG